MRILQFHSLEEPAQEPVSLAEAKAQLRINGFDEDEAISDHPDDALIEAMISAAREHAELFTGLVLARRNVICLASSFPECRKPININTGPVLSVDDVSYYLDGELVPMSMSELHIETLAIPATISLPSSASWPTADNRAGAVRIQLDAGYVAEPASDVENERLIPPSIKQAILLLMSHMYENREAVTDKPFALLPLGVESLLRRHRIRLGV